VIERRVLRLVDRATLELHQPVALLDPDIRAESRSPSAGWSIAAAPRAAAVAGQLLAYARLGLLVRPARVNSAG
jgi:hypothetical protein